MIRALPFARYGLLTCCHHHPIVGKKNEIQGRHADHSEYLRARTCGENRQEGLWALFSGGGKCRWSAPKAIMVLSEKRTNGDDVSRRLNCELPIITQRNDPKKSHVIDIGGSYG